MRIIICILAGGASSRFGESKLNIRIGDQPLLAWHRSHLADVEPDEWWLSLGPNQALPPGADGYDRIVHDEREHCGPLHGIYAAVSAAEAEDGMLILPADMPIPSVQLMQVLCNCLALSPQQAAVMPKWGLGERANEIEPFPSIWRAGPAKQMLSMAIEKGLGGPRQVADWPPVGKTYLHDDSEEVVSQFTNINMPEDMAAVEKIVGLPVSHFH